MRLKVCAVQDYIYPAEHYVGARGYWLGRIKICGLHYEDIVHGASHGYNPETKSVCMDYATYQRYKEPNFDA